MVSRRQVLVGGGGLAVMNLGLPAVSVQAADTRSRPALFIYDRLVPDIDAVLKTVSREAVPMAAMTGDIGTAWMAHLEPMWREQPHAVAGLTFGGALFCLEDMGRSYGLACTFSAAPSSEDELAATIFAALRSAGGTSANVRLNAFAASDRPVVWRMQQVRPETSRARSNNETAA